jgi:hypothetical protein
LNEVRQDAMNLVRGMNLKVGRDGGNLDDESPRSTFQRKDVPTCNGTPMSEQVYTLIVEVVDIQGHCPVYRIGDRFRISQCDGGPRTEDRAEDGRPRTEDR